nr:IS4 family transposase [Deinococcus peraridilitoris]
MGCALILAQSTRHVRLAPHLPGAASLEAKKRRVERCLQDEQLDAEVFLCLLISLLPPGKLMLALDRTNWEHGEADLNLLVLGVVLEGFTLPLVWTALPHGGSSNTAARERLVAKLLKHLPAKRIKVLVADREFLGGDWFSFLRKRKIKRCIRIRLDTKVDDLRVDAAYKHVQPGQVVGLLEKANVYGNVMQVVVTRTKDGELFALATDLKIWEARTAYQLRFSVECTFAALKSRGLGLEESHMTKANRLERLFGLLTLAFACCLRVGVWRNGLKPIRRKKHGRRAVSVFRYGWELLVNALRWALPDFQTYLALLSQPFPALGATGGEGVMY